MKNLKRFNDIKADVKDVFQDIIDRYNIYEESDDCRPGGIDDKNYYYSIDSGDQNGFIKSRLEKERYSCALWFVTADVLENEKVFYDDVCKDIGRLNRMGYKTKCDLMASHNIIIYIK